MGKKYTSESIARIRPGDKVTYRGLPREIIEVGPVLVAEHGPRAGMKCRNLKIRNPKMSAPLLTVIVREGYEGAI